MLQDCGIMPPKKYTDAELINELRRFYNENGRVPRRDDMKYSNGYITAARFINQFGSFTNALLNAGLQPRTHLYNGTEACSMCNNSETDHWRYINNNRLCNKCYSKLYKHNRTKKTKLDYSITSSEYDSYSYKYDTNNNTLYTDTFLLDKIKRFYTEYNKVPTIKEFSQNKDYPSIEAYKTHFVTWNNAIQLAGFNIHTEPRKLTGDELCEICHEKTTGHWYYINNKYICNKCKHGNRLYLNGIANVNSKCGLGIISEYIVHKVLNDTIWFNADITTFNYKYDLYNDIYKNINVKCSNFNITHNKWTFSIKNKNNPDTFIFICLGINTKTIAHVFIIPYNDSILKNKNFITITNTSKSLLKFKNVEVDSIPYDNIYKNLNIHDIYHFRNLPDEIGEENV
jgi:hypothetical protein